MKTRFKTYLISAVYVLSIVLAFICGVFWKQAKSVRLDEAKDRYSFAPAAPSSDGQSTPAFNEADKLVEFNQNRARLAEVTRNMNMLRTNGVSNAQLMSKFQQQNQSLLARQRDLGQAILEKQAQREIPMPQPLKIAPSVSAQMREYLIARDKLTRSQIEFANQHRLDEPATRMAAMRQWNKDNASQIKSLRDMSEAISKQK